MKHQFALLFALGISYCALGQFGKSTFKNTLTVGGDAQLSYKTYFPNDKSLAFTNFGISLSPDIGIFLTPELLTGFLVDYSYTKIKPKSGNISASPSRSHSIAAGVYLRYYYQKYFVEGRVFGGESTSGDEYTSGDIEYYTLQIGIGKAIMISKQLAIEPKLSYNIDRFGRKADLKSNGFEFSIGIRNYFKPQGRS